jgi:hypothetical protein
MKLSEQIAKHCLNKEIAKGKIKCKQQNNK